MGLGLGLFAFIQKSGIYSTNAWLKRKTPVFKSSRGMNWIHELTNTALDRA